MTLRLKRVIIRRGKRSGFSGILPAKTALVGLCLLCFVMGGGNVLGVEPDDVVHTVGRHQLKLKHVTAYIRMELEGEDPSLLQDDKTIEELTRELLEDFAEDPEEILRELNEYIAATQTGAGPVAGGANVGSQPRPDLSAGQYPQEVRQWKQLLNGSVLYYSTTESRGGLFVQSTQYLHLCPDGKAHFYQSSTGGGEFGGIGIADPGQLEYTGSANWAVSAQGSNVFFQVTMPGARPGAFPIGMMNDKVLIQGLGHFSVQRGAARCQ